MHNLVALVYLDSAPEVFPNDSSREHGLLLAANLTYVQPRTPASSYLACGLSQGDAVHVMETDQLAMLLRAHEGNVAAVARQLGVRRETIYHRAARANLEIDNFRPRPRRLRLRTI
jgi:transcriptional regulator of acetoin/glycerol metabolism